MRFRALIAAVLLATSFFTISAGEVRTPTGWIGLGYTFHQSSNGKAPWLHVQQLAPDGPAYLAGVRPQDVITAIDGRRISFADKAQALAFFAGLTPGRKVKFSILRRDKKLTIHVKAVPLPAQYQQRWDHNREHLKRRQ